MTHALLYFFKSGMAEQATISEESCSLSLLCMAENRKMGQLKRLNSWFTSRQYPFKGEKISHFHRTAHKATAIPLSRMSTDG